MIPALVLTAGLATRLRPLSLVRAKAALPVAGEPLVRRILRWLRAWNVTDVVMNLHHLPQTIARCVGDGSDLGMRVRYSWEVPILGSAGGPRLALPILGARTFLIVNGDTLTDVEIPALVEAHRRSGAQVTMAVTDPPAPDRYGGVLSDVHGAVTGFVGRRSTADCRHFVGVQAVEADAFARVAGGTAAESVGGLYPSLIRAQPGSVRVHEAPAEFFDVGTADDYLRTALLFAAREDGARTVGARARIAGTARIDSSILWDDVTVGAGARLRGCVVADGAEIPANTTWEHATLRPFDGALDERETRVGALAVGRLGGARA